MPRYAILGLCAVAATAACGKKAPPAPAVPEVVVAPVVRQDVPVYREWVGTLDGVVNATIQPKVTGFLVRQAYQPGFVHQGDLLFEIDSREFAAQLAQAQGVLDRSRATLQRTKNDVARYTPLAAQKAISQQELDNAVSAQEEAEAATATATANLEQARLNMNWASVKAPIDGVVGVPLVQVGDLVKPSDVMTTLSTVNPIKVVFNISEREYLEYSAKINAPGAAGNREGRLELVLDNDSTYGPRGNLVLANRQVDIRTGTLTLEGHFPNPGNILRPGQFARVRAVMQIRKGAMLIPQSAVLELQGIYQVGVVGSDGKVEMRVVNLSERVGQLWLVDGGLKPDDKVIVEGLQRVRAGMTVTTRTAAPPAPVDSSASKGR